MINSVSASTGVSDWHQAQHTQRMAPPPKPKEDQQRQDTVELSRQAQQEVRRQHQQSK
jgi:hypothetical protein